MTLLCQFGSSLRLKHPDQPCDENADLRYAKDRLALVIHPEHQRLDRLPHAGRSLAAGVDRPARR